MNDRRSTDRREFLLHATARAAAAGLAVGAARGLVAADPAAAKPARDVAWLAELQRPPEKPADGPVPKLRPPLVDAQGRQITSVDAWRERRAELTRQWLDFLGPLEVARDRLPEVEVLEEDHVGDVYRKRVRYRIEPDLFTEAYILHPAQLKGRRPAAVVFHSTVDHSIRQPAGVEGVPEKFFGLKLAQRGFVTFCPRNFLWPDNGRIVAQEETKRFQQRHPRAKGMAKMLYDAQVALDLLVDHAHVDPRRIAAVGHSLGAKEALYLAALDERICAAVSSEGGIGTKLSNWDAPWYLGPTIKQPDFQLEHHELLALCAPRPFLLIGGDSADGAVSWPYVEAALPAYRLYGEPARLGLLNHGQGHRVPQAIEPRIYEWLETYV